MNKWIKTWIFSCVILYLDVGWPIRSLYSHDNPSKTAKQFLARQRYQSTIAIVGLEQDAAYSASNPSIKATKVYQNSLLAPSLIGKPKKDYFTYLALIIHRLSLLLSFLLQIQLI